MHGLRKLDTYSDVNEVRSKEIRYSDVRDVGLRSKDWVGLLGVNALATTMVYTYSDVNEVRSNEVRYILMQSSSIHPESTSKCYQLGHTAICCIVPLPINPVTPCGHIDIANSHRCI